MDCFIAFTMPALLKKTQGGCATLPTQRLHFAIETVGKELYPEEYPC